LTDGSVCRTTLRADEIGHQVGVSLENVVATWRFQPATRVPSGRRRRTRRCSCRSACQRKARARSRWPPETKATIHRGCEVHGDRVGGWAWAGVGAGVGWGLGRDGAIPGQAAGVRKWTGFLPKYCSPTPFGFRKWTEYHDRPICSTPRAGQCRPYRVLVGRGTPRLCAKCSLAAREDIKRSRDQVLW